MADTLADVRARKADGGGDVAGSASRPAPRSRARLVFAVTAALALLGTGLHLVLTHGRESTDNAQVVGHVIHLAPRVSSVISEVLVREHDTVRAGQLLVRLDARELDARLAEARAQLKAVEAARDSSEAELAAVERTVPEQLKRARAELTRAELAVKASRSNLAREQAELRASGAQERFAVGDFFRARKLHELGAASLAALDDRRTAHESAAAAAAKARAQSQSALRALGISRASVDVAEAELNLAEAAQHRILAARAAAELARARVEQARANVELAELNRSYAELRAPAAGAISQLNAEVGQSTTPGRPLMALVRSDDLWVVANFKETQLERMRPGMPARIDVDAFPDLTLRGRVRAIGGAVGSLFSLLPPDNSSGNYVKVVQRVPVAIAIESAPAIVPGMSVVATVDTRGP